MTVNRIRQACHEVLAKKEYLPKLDGTTFCNYGVHEILSKLGFPEFCWDQSKAQRPMLANDIAEKCENELCELDIMNAFDAAKEGRIVLAAIKMPNHGHVAILYPFPAPYYSGKWKMEVPCVANIGKDNGIIPINWAFGAMPKFYEVKK